MVVLDQGSIGKLILLPNFRRLRLAHRVHPKHGSGENLVPKTNECVGPSSEWSCVKHVTPKERDARKTSEYGFSAGEGGRRADGAQEDFGYVKQQPYIPHISVRAGEGAPAWPCTTPVMKSVELPQVRVTGQTVSRLGSSKCE